MATSMKRKVLVTAFYSRVVVILLQALLTNIVPDHEADAYHYKPSEELTFGDHVTYFFLGGFSKWDGAHFISIAERGYVEERQFAFFPFLPLMMYTTANTILAPCAVFLNVQSRLLIAATGINIISFVLAACGMFTLGEHVLKDRHLAMKAALLFCINPATVFFSSVYTESLFSALTFYGMLSVEKNHYATSTFLFSCSMCTRSNGMISCGFILYKFTRVSFHSLYLRKQFNSFTSKLLLSCLIHALTVVASTFIIIFPFIVFQLFAYVTVCTSNVNLFGYLRDQFSGNVLLISTNASVWCQDRIPLIYSYIQSHYWDVGFLKYYQVKKMPNFILASPMILLCVAAACLYGKRKWSLIKHLGLVPMMDEKKRNPVGYLADGVFPYIVHMMVLLLFAVTCINIEVVTRLIASCCPVFYWYVASTLSWKENSEVHATGTRQQHIRKPLTPDPSQDSLSLLWDGVLMTTLRQLFHVNDFKTKVILIYFLTYCFLGILLHCNFFPWT